MKSPIDLRALIALFTLVSSAPSAPSATIDSGVIIGAVTSLPSSTVRVNQFLGVPFAQPPVGDRRFAPPAQPMAWTTPLKTTKYPPACVQQFSDPPAAQAFQEKMFNTPGPPSGESEDCLYINVYAPTLGAKNKTVMFWIYGGGYIFGANSLPLYNGVHFAANQDVIIVTTNYRTNAFGFPRSPLLPLAENNLGYLDQRLALDWVQRNIHAFGGSPEKVTIFGQSAGAESVDDLITTNPKNAPFRAAILQSAQSSFGPARTQKNSDTAAWTTLMSKLNCTGSASDTLACARAASAATIKSIAEQGALTFAPMSDNVTRLENPIAARAAGDIARVPTLAGSTANDGSTFAVPAGNASLATFLQSIAPGVPASVVAKISSLYPTSLTPNGVIAAVLTDYIFQCPAALFANSTVTQAHAPAWMYYFNATFANTQHPAYADLDLGVYHSSEIPLVFGTYPRDGATPSEIGLSQLMQGAWAGFAKHPYTGPGWAEWPRVEVLGTPGRAQEVNASVVELDERCAVYDAIYALSGEL